MKIVVEPFCSCRWLASTAWKGRTRQASA